MKQKLFSGQPLSAPAPRHGVLIYAVESPEKLSRRGRPLEKGAECARLTPISLAEIAIKAALGKITIVMARFGRRFRIWTFEFCPTPLPRVRVV